MSAKVYDLLSAGPTRLRQDQWRALKRMSQLGLLRRRDAHTSLPTSDSGGDQAFATEQGGAADAWSEIEW